MLKPVGLGSHLPSYIDTLVHLEAPTFDKRTLANLNITNASVEVETVSTPMQKFGIDTGQGAFKIKLDWLHTAAAFKLAAELNRCYGSTERLKELGISAVILRNFNERGVVFSEQRYLIRTLEKVRTRYDARYEMRGIHRRADELADTLYKELDGLEGIDYQWRLWNMRQSAEIRDLLCTQAKNSAKSNYVSATFTCDLVEAKS